MFYLIDIKFEDESEDIVEFYRERSLFGNGSCGAGNENGRAVVEEEEARLVCKVRRSREEGDLLDYNVSGGDVDRFLQTVSGSHKRSVLKLT